MNNRLEIVKRFYIAFAQANRNEFVEDILAPNFTFSAPPDPFLERNGFFERCWPNGTNLKEMHYTRLFQHDDEVVVSHEYLKPDGIKGCNTDIFTFSGEKIIRLEVYFGWDISD